MPRCTSLSQPHDPGLSRMLIVYIVTGIAFMVLPGTLVGVMNLLTISATHTASAASAGWVQAHGHAQIFGWLGTFILGIGYYTIPRLRLSAYCAIAAWTTWGLWTAGVAMRWASGSFGWNWRIVFPLGALLELAAVAIFCAAVLLTPPRTPERSWRTSILLIAAAGWGMLMTAAVGAAQSLVVAFDGEGPLFPFDFNQRYLVLITWGFIVPFVWGYSTRWLPPLLGLRKSWTAGYLPAVALLFAGVAVAMAGALFTSSLIVTAASFVFIASLRLWEPAAKDPKLRGVHPSSTLFLRLAYVWLVIAAGLGIAAAALPLPNGYAGASRHALTVGFFAGMVFVIGPRVLPAFFGVRRLWSGGLMAASLVLLNAGCFLRVLSQVIAYEGLHAFAWKTLPFSAVIEMAAVCIFALNMMMTLGTGSPLEVFLEAQKEREAAV